MTKEGFEKLYIEGSKISRNYYDENFVTLPCKCGEDGCEGWACVTNKPRQVQIHKELYT